LPEQNEYNFMPNTTYAVFRKCNPDWTLHKFTMPNYDLSYIIEGRGQYVINGTFYTAEPGDLFCLPPGSVREGITSRDHPMKIYAVDFHLKDFNGESVNLPISVKTHIGVHHDLVRLFDSLVAAWLEKKPGFTIKIHGLLLLILHCIYELCVYDNKDTVDDYRIAKAVSYIHANYRENIKVEKLAALTKLEPHYFNTLFRQKTGVPLHKYIIKTRIRNAYDMLQTGNYKLGEIAAQCGYRDIYHFYKQFKLIIGVPPSHCAPEI